MGEAISKNKLVIKEKTFRVNVKPSSFINYGAIKKVQLFLLMMMIVDVLSARNQRLSHCSNFTRIKCVSARNQRESFGNSLKEWQTVMYDVSCYQIASFARFLFLTKKSFFILFSSTTPMYVMYRKDSSS